MTNAHTRAWLALAMILFATPRLHAQTSTAGTPVAVTHLAAESNPSVISDGAGGAFVGFKVGWRSAELPAEIAVGRVLASAGRHPEWTALPPTPAGSMLMSQFAPTRILLAPQGQVLAFGDATSTSQPQAHFVRRMEADGVDPSYGTFAPDYSYSLFSVLPRSDGGATVFSRVPESRNCLATIVSPTGTAIQVFTPMAFNQYDSFTFGGERVTAVPTAGNGAIVVLAAALLGGSTSQIDLIAVKLSGNGNAVWTPVHRVISNAAKDQLEQVMTSDDADGAIVAWGDGRSLTVGPDIYAVRLMADGTYAPGWPVAGKSICNAGRAQYAPAIERDGAGGAWFGWTDERDTLSGPDIYFTHILADGSVAAGFAANGRALCNAAGTQAGVQFTRDGSGGLFAVWLDARDGETDLYAQHLNASGNPTPGWAIGGNPVCTDGTAQAQPAVSWVSNGRAIVAWKDARTGTDVVYAAALDATLGVLDATPVVLGRLALAAGANPARDAVEFRLDTADAGDVTVTLYDVSGRLSSERVITGPARSASVRFEGLQPGLYFASAEQKGSRASARVVVIR